MAELCTRLLKIIVRVGAHKGLSFAAAELLVDIATTVQRKGKPQHPRTCAFFLLSWIACQGPVDHHRGAPRRHHHYTISQVNDSELFTCFIPFHLLKCD